MRAASCSVWIAVAALVIACGPSARTDVDSGEAAGDDAGATEVDSGHVAEDGGGVEHDGGLSADAGAPDAAHGPACATPALLDFADVELGESTDKVVTISACTSEGWSLDGLRVSGSGFSLRQGPVVPPSRNLSSSDNFSVVIAYKPTAAEPNSGTIDVRVNGGDWTPLVRLSGHGVRVPPVCGPTADAGPDIVVRPGVVVALDSSRSRPRQADAQLSFVWEIVSLPISSRASPPLLGIFKPDVAGEYRLRLTVTEGTCTVTDEVLVRADPNGPSPCEGAIPVAEVSVSLAGAPVAATSDTFEPLQEVRLDATHSHVATGRSPTYRWSIIGAPEGVPLPPGLNNSRLPLFLQRVGSYTAEVVVSDEYGCEGAPKRTTVYAVPSSRVYFELTWPEAYGNLDLHYLGPNGTLFDEPRSGSSSDVYVSYKTPDWGLNGTTAADGNSANDASLVADTLWGPGIEAVRHAQPFDATYKVLVTYYCSRRMTGSSYGASSGAATPTVTVFVDGVARISATPPASVSLTQRDVWEVATITVGNGSIAVTPLSTPLRKTTVATQACTPDRN